MGAGVIHTKLAYKEASMLKPNAAGNLAVIIMILMIIGIILFNA